MEVVFQESIIKQYGTIQHGVDPFIILQKWNYCISVSWIWFLMLMNKTIISKNCTIMFKIITTICNTSNKQLLHQHEQSTVKGQLEILDVTTNLAAQVLLL